MYDLISYVTRGRVRKEVLKGLSKPLTPTQLSRKINTHRSTTSRAIIALEEKKLVECLTPKEKMGRYYQITKTGKKIMDEIKNSHSN